MEAYLFSLCLKENKLIDSLMKRMMLSYELQCRERQEINSCSAILKLWPLEQQQNMYLKVCSKYKFLAPHPRSTESRYLRWGPTIGFNKPSK